MASSVMLPVLLSAALHAGWNALIKSGTARYLDTLLVVVGSAAVGGGLIAFLPAPARESWPCIAASTAIHVVYLKLVALAYHYGDLSLVYPLTRGSAPALTAVAALAVLHESPSIGGWLGVFLISGGVLTLTADARRTGRVRLIPAALALGNAGVVAAYTLVDGAGARLSGRPLSYTSWLTVSTAAVFALIAVATRGRRAVAHVAAGWRKGLAGGACTFASYSLVLWAMTRAPLVLVSAVRETSVVFGALIAVGLLGERISRIRCAAIAVVTAGAVVVKLF